ncbi:MAG TPA: HAD family phosphatase [Trebonia sp.]|jgi:HAD superfamily hydrolase (TIGR01509 family)|nr:HAD family phosphatase [Trebonia sp.]
MIEAVVFDLDGVLIDSEPVWEQVRRELVAARGGRWQPDTQDRLMGMSTGEWSRYMSAGLALGMSPGEVADAVIAAMAGRYAAHLPLLPGAVACVRALAARWPLAVASSAPQSLIEVVLDASGLRPSFAVALSSERVARGKPAPDVYLAAVERLGVAPARCAAVEDSSNGLRSAAAAGLAVIAVPHPKYPPAPDALEAARLVLGGLGELTPEAVAALDGTRGQA